MSKIILTPGYSARTRRGREARIEAIRAAIAAAPDVADAALAGRFGVSVDYVRKLRKLFRRAALLEALPPADSSSEACAARAASVKAETFGEPRGPVGLPGPQADLKEICAGYALEARRVWRRLQRGARS